MHWDLRLEWRGVLLSWAVPKGPSLDPSQKRLAVRVEDHPVEYADFEGQIPADNYGAGSVIVWDLGQWVPVEDPDAGLESGKLLFDLRGYKARGRFTLVRTTGRGERRDANEWLLIKKKDAYSREAPGWTDASVLSGLRVEEIGHEAEASTATLAELEALGAPRSELRRLRPMLAERLEEPFSDPDWIFEVKYDGYRAICSNPNGNALIQYRSESSS
jgi:bifunctional non-homologous end joining protein LigD